MDMNTNHSMGHDTNHSMDHDMDHDMGHDMDHNMGHGMDHNMMGHNMGHMQMFYFGASNVTVLFESWNINSIWGLVGSFIGIFVISILYEGLKVFREVLKQNAAKFCGRPVSDSVHCEKKVDTSTKLKGSCDATRSQSQVPVITSLGLHVIQTLLHMIQVTVSYFLMLIAMTYNAWLFIAVVLGSGTGYFLFAKFRKSEKSSLQDLSEHCN